MSAAGLSAAECAAYRRDGFVRAGRIFDDRRFDLVRRRIRHRLDHLPAGIDGEKMLNWHLCDRWLLRLALRPEIIDRVIGLIGPHVALFNTRILSKPPAGGRDVPWHQDAPYWPLDPPIVTTFWLAIDDVTQANGAMRMLPGMHRQGRLEHVPVAAGAHVFDEEIRSDLVDEGQAVLLTMTAGEASFHDGFTPHSSGANRTGERRSAFIARYIPTTAALDRSRRDLYGEGYPLFWVRGAPGANRYVNRRFAQDEEEEGP